MSNVTPDYYGRRSIGNRFCIPHLGSISFIVRCFSLLPYLCTRNCDRPSTDRRTFKPGICSQLWSHFKMAAKFLFHLFAFAPFRHSLFSLPFFAFSFPGSPLLSWFFWFVLLCYIFSFPFFFFFFFKFYFILFHYYFKIIFKVSFTSFWINIYIFFYDFVLFRDYFFNLAFYRFSYHFSHFYLYFEFLHPFYLIFLVDFCPFFFRSILSFSFPLSYFAVRLIFPSLICFLFLSLVLSFFRFRWVFLSFFLFLSVCFVPFLF